MAGSDPSPTLNKSGLTGSAPRCYTKHQRYRGKGLPSFTVPGNFSSYLLKADQFSAFLAAQASRLSTTTAVVFNKLQKYTADKIRSATNLSQLP